MKKYICSLAASLLLSSSVALADNVAVIPLPANTSDDKQLLYNDRGVATGAEIYFDKNSGNVGIGTATPTQQLEVAGTVQATAFTVGGIPLMASSSTFWSFLNDDLFTFGDVIMQRSLAVGQESSPGFDFQFDTIALMDREVSILFQDTSNAASFPSNDWRLTANDSQFGGDNYFAIEDVTGGTRPFIVEAGAPDNSIYVAGTSGNVGIGTATPQSSLQVGGYLQLDLTAGAPPAADCDDPAEIGRMIVDSGAGLLYVCANAGWIAK